MVTNKRLGYGFAAATIAIWSGFVLVSRVGSTSGLNPYDITFLRFGVAALLLFPVWLCWRRRNFFNRQMLGLVATGGIGYALVAYTALSLAPASHGAVLISGLLPFFVPLAAFIALREKPRPAIWYALPVIAVGVLCLGVDIFSSSKNSLAGDALLVLASLIWAVYTLQARAAQLHPWDLTIGSVLMSALIFIPIYWLFLPKLITSASWEAIALQGIYQGVLVVIIAMLSFMAALKHLGATRLGAVMALVPAVAGFSAFALLGESLSGWLIAGLIATSLGAYLGSRE